MIEFQQIREAVNIEEVAKWLGLEVRGGKTKCPFHNDKTPSLSFKDGRFKCFGCEASGDAIDLVAKLRHVSIAEAAQQIVEAFHINCTVPAKKKPPVIDHKKMTEYIDASIQTFALTPSAQMYLQGRGFTGESMMQFRFGYDAVRKAVVIPYGTQSDYYTCRCIAEKQFYKPRTEEAGPEPLFYEESLDQEEPVFVVESAFCALSIMQEGGYAVSTCGTGARKLVDALKGRSTIPALIICMDRDEAGKNASQKLCGQLKSMGIAHLSTTTPEGYKDPNELLTKDPVLFRTWLQDAVVRAKELPPAEQHTRRSVTVVPPLLYTLQPECKKLYLRTDIGSSSDVRHTPEI